MANLYITLFRVLRSLHHASFKFTLKISREFSGLLTWSLSAWINKRQARWRPAWKAAGWSDVYRAGMTNRVVVLTWSGWCYAELAKWSYVKQIHWSYAERVKWSYADKAERSYTERPGWSYAGSVECGVMLNE